MIDGVISSPIVSGTELVMQGISNRYSRGIDLTGIQTNMTMSATGASYSDYYGPGPAEMVLNTPALPEHVAGVLMSYSA